MDTTMQQDFRYISAMVIKPAIATAILAAYFSGIFGPF
mgnify:FL=1